MANIGGTVSTNLKGGNDIQVQAGQVIGDEKFNAAAGVFAKGNDQMGPVTTGAFAEINA